MFLLKRKTGVWSVEILNAFQYHGQRTLQNIQEIKKIKKKFKNQEFTKDTITNNTKINCLISKFYLRTTDLLVFKLPLNSNTFFSP